MPFRVTTSVSLAPIETLTETARKRQHFPGAVSGGAHKCTAHDDSIGELADGARLGRSRDAEPDANRKISCRAQSLNRIGKSCFCGVPHAGDTEPADKINESAAVPCDFRHPLTRSGRRNEPYEVERAAGEPLLALWICTNGNVGDENP